jgi:glycerol-3-phosphate acyltransferase PlsY
MLAKIILWTILAFLLGSIPFSLLVGQLFSKKDIRTFGDGNPGAYNVWHICGWQLGVLAILLDVGKGTLPIFLAQLQGLGGWSLVPVALAPIFGHGFSPFLSFRGGKAVATTLGVWFGLTGITGIIAFAVLAILSMGFLSEHAWVVVCGMGGIIAYLLFTQSPIWLLAIAAANLLLLQWKHRHELLQPIQVRDLRSVLWNRRNS